MECRGRMAIAPGRPFLAAMAAKEEDYPTAEFSALAGAVEMPSDWNEGLNCGQL